MLKKKSGFCLKIRRAIFLNCLKIWKFFAVSIRRICGTLFYNSAPEAWLESLLRRNIKLLDANLILSPVYHQFRAERDKIDLLALAKRRTFNNYRIKGCARP